MAGRYPDAATGHPEGDRPQPVTHRQPSDHTQNQHDDKDDDEDPDNAVTRTKRQDNRHAPPPIEQFRGMRARQYAPTRWASKPLSRPGCDAASAGKPRRVPHRCWTRDWRPSRVSRQPPLEIERGREVWRGRVPETAPHTRVEARRKVAAPERSTDGPVSAVRTRVELAGNPRRAYAAYREASLMSPRRDGHARSERP